MNVELLQKVKEHILREPELFDMSSWLQDDNGEDIWDTDSFRYDCGSAACIAGWAIILGTQQYVTNPEVEDKAIDLLNLSYSQADKLFYVTNWESEYRRRYINATTAREKAIVAAERIDSFIEENA